MHTLSRDTLQLLADQLELPQLQALSMTTAYVDVNLNQDYWKKRTLQHLGLGSLITRSDTTNWKQLYQQITKQPSKTFSLLLESGVDVDIIVAWFSRQPRVDRALQSIIYTNRYDVILPLLTACPSQTQCLVSWPWGLFRGSCPLDVLAKLIQLRMSKERSTELVLKQWFNELADADLNRDVILERTILLESVASTTNTLKKLRLQAAITYDNAIQFLYYATTMSELVEEELQNMKTMGPRISKLIVSCSDDETYESYLQPPFPDNAIPFYAAVIADPRTTDEMTIDWILEYYGKSLSDMSVAGLWELMTLLGSRAYLLSDLRLLRYIDYETVLGLLDTQRYDRQYYFSLLSVFTDSLVYGQASIDETFGSLTRTRIEKAFRSFAQRHPEMTGDTELIRQLLDHHNLLVSGLLLQFPGEVLQERYLNNLEARQEFEESLLKMIGSIV
jgi:hypothetical protein